MQTYEAVPNTQVFRNAQPFAGMRTNGELGGREAEGGTSSPFGAIIRDERVFEIFGGGEPAFARVLHFEVSAWSLASDFGPRKKWLARTLSTQAQAGGEKHNADRGDNPARARIGSSGFVPVGQYVLQRSVGSRSSEKRLVHPSSEACAGVGEGYAKRG